jgi:glycosyltransferase involved in cell wall biosynthesis
MTARQPRRDWFRAAVRSALGQEGCSIELIIVDDGSPDPIEPLLDGIDDPRLRVLRTAHGGVARARTTAAAQAAGEYMRFIDADDVLEPGSTARLLRLSGDAPQPTISYGATAYCDQDLRPIELRTSNLQGWVAEQCLLYRFDVRCLSMLFPRGVVEAVGDWDPTLRHCQDWDYVLRALELAPVRGEHEIATFYRRHGEAQTAKLDAVLHFEALVVDRYFERHPERIGTRLERRARAQLLRVRADTGAALGQGRRQRLRDLEQAFSMDRAGTVAHVLRRAAASSQRRIHGARRVLTGRRRA